MIAGAAEISCASMRSATSGLTATSPGLTAFLCRKRVIALIPAEPTGHTCRRDDFRRMPILRFIFLACPRASAADEGLRMPPCHAGFMPSMRGRRVAAGEVRPPLRWLRGAWALGCNAADRAARRAATGHFRLRRRRPRKKCFITNAASAQCAAARRIVDVPTH